MRSRRRRVVLASGVVLELAEGGRQAGRTVLALHGEDGLASMAATVDHLGVEHRVIAPAHPGWAGTVRAADPSAVGALARAYLDLLALDGARDAVVVGASFGGWVAAQMALDDDQGRIGALVLLGPLGLRAPGRVVRSTTARTRGAPARRSPGAYAGPPAWDPTLVARLGAVAVPALVLWGREDTVTDAACARAWARALGDGELVLIAGAGHLPCHRAAGMTFAAIDAFLSPPLILTA